jgi:hypothetical protein
MNTVPPDRVREFNFSLFDFSLDSERHAMGELPGQLSQRSFARAGLLISVLVQYLNASDAGPRFYELARRRKLLRPRPTRDQKLTFWISQVKAVCRHDW